VKPEAQRIAIAEACGVTIREEQDGSGLWSAEGPRWSSYKTGLSLNHAQRVSLPDYLNDLNAMHEAEKGLTPEQRDTYICHLGTVVGHWDIFEDIGAVDAIATATAAQRAEAFLRTIGKWTDEQ